MTVISHHHSSCSHHHMQSCIMPGAGEAQSSKGSLSKKCINAAKENHPSAICSVTQRALHTSWLHYKRRDKWKENSCVCSPVRRLSYGPVIIFTLPRLNEGKVTPFWTSKFPQPEIFTADLVSSLGIERCLLLLILLLIIITTIIITAPGTVSRKVNLALFC